MDILEKRIRARVAHRVPPSLKKPRKRTWQQIKKTNARYIIYKIKTGDINLNKRSHAILLNSAIKYGYVDKDLNILLEP
jgi:hypothetical protein